MSDLIVRGDAIELNLLKYVTDEKNKDSMTKFADSLKELENFFQQLKDIDTLAKMPLFLINLLIFMSNDERMNVETSYLFRVMALCMYENFALLRSDKIQKGGYPMRVLRAGRLITIDNTEFQQGDLTELEMGANQAAYVANNAGQEMARYYPREEPGQEMDNDTQTAMTFEPDIDPFEEELVQIKKQMVLEAAKKRLAIVKGEMTYGAYIRTILASSAAGFGTCCILHSCNQIARTVRKGATRLASDVVTGVAQTVQTNTPDVVKSGVGAATSAGNLVSDFFTTGFERFRIRTNLARHDMNMMLGNYGPDVDLELGGIEIDLGDVQLGDDNATSIYQKISDKFFENTIDSSIFWIGASACCATACCYFQNEIEIARRQQDTAVGGIEIARVSDDVNRRNRRNIATGARIAFGAAALINPALAPVAGTMNAMLNNPVDEGPPSPPRRRGGPIVQEPDSPPVRQIERPQELGYGVRPAQAQGLRQRNPPRLQITRGGSTAGRKPKNRKMPTKKQNKKNKKTTMNKKMSKRSTMKK